MRESNGGKNDLNNSYAYMKYQKHYNFLKLKKKRRLERRLSSQECLLLLQRTHVRLLAPTEQFTTVQNPVPQIQHPFLTSGYQACVCHTCKHGCKTLTHIK